MNEREKREIYAALLRAAIAAIRVERRRALAASIGWHPDEEREATDLSEMRRHMNHANTARVAAARVEHERIRALEASPP